MHFNVKLLVQHLCSSLVYSSGNFGQKMWARKEKKKMTRITSPMLTWALIILVKVFMLLYSKAGSSRSCYCLKKNSWPHYELKPRPINEASSNLVSQTILIHTSWWSDVSFESYKFPQRRYMRLLRVLYCLFVFFFENYNPIKMWKVLSEIHIFGWIQF